MLPTKPLFFDKELEDILQVDGKPFFRCVNPETEKHFSVGKIRLKHPDFQNFCKPKQCWVIEYYQSPREINRKAWESIRWRDVQIKGVLTRTDLLGDYPENGRYVFFCDVADEKGNPIPPNQKFLDKLKLQTDGFMAKYKQWENETPAQGERKILEYTDELEKEKIARYTEEFFQFHGIAANRAFNTVISKPLIQTKPTPKIEVIK